jgi:hypothetical protein
VTPRVHVVDVRLAIGETLHLTPISDAHIESSDCDYPALKKMADERRDLPHHQVIWIGDFCNLVTPVDLKRFRPSVQSPGVALRDDWINAATEEVTKRIEGLNLKHALFGPGNHEDSAIQHSGYDITSVIASHFHAARGGYSGVLDYKITTSTNCRVLFRILYHHGAWGGRLAKGYNGAWPFFSAFDFWNIAIFGHNHASRVDPELRRRVHDGKIEEYPVWLLNCGSFVQTYGEDAGVVHYEEKRGYMVHPRTCPLIRVTPRERYSRAGGRKERHIYCDVRIEV